MSSFIEIKDLHFSYVNDLEEPPVKTEVLKGINLNIEKGEFVAVLGHNGSGKSTLAKCINAINLPESGAVYVNGMDTLDENNLLPIREKVGMVFQNPDNQIVATIVEEDVAFALENMASSRMRYADVLTRLLKPSVCMNTDFMHPISFQADKNSVLLSQA